MMIPSIPSPSSLWQPFRDIAENPIERKAAIVRAVVSIAFSIAFAWGMQGAFSTPDNVVSLVGVVVSAIFCIYIARSLILSTGILLAAYLYKPDLPEPWTLKDIAKGFLSLG